MLTDWTNQSIPGLHCPQSSVTPGKLVTWPQMCKRTWTKNKFKCIVMHHYDIHVYCVTSYNTLITLKKTHTMKTLRKMFSSCELFYSHIFDTVWYLESIGWKVFLVHEMASGEFYWTQLDLHSWVVTNNVSRLKSVLILCMLHDSKSWFVSQAMTSVWMNFSVPVVVKSLLQRNRMIVL